MDYFALYCRIFPIYLLMMGDVLMTETNDSGNGLKIRSFLHQNYIDEPLQLTPKGKILQNLTESHRICQRSNAQHSEAGSPFLCRWGSVQHIAVHIAKMTGAIVEMNWTATDKNKSAAEMARGDSV